MILHDSPTRGLGGGERDAECYTEPLAGVEGRA